jgi:hypothetical protein
MLLFAAAVRAQTFTNIVISIPIPLMVANSNGTLFITAAPQHTNDTNGFTVAFVVYSPSIPDHGPLSVTIDSSLGTYSVNHVPIRQWSYIWGDGSPFENRTDYPDANFVSHIYPAPGTYPFTLIVTDNDGNTNSLSRQITVPVPALAANAQGISLSSPTLESWIPIESNDLRHWTPSTNTLPIRIPIHGSKFFRLMQP